MRNILQNSSAFNSVFVLGVTALNCVQAGPGNEAGHIKAGVGQILYEQIGQGINYPTPGEGAQFGYFTYVKGLENVFTGVPENETTAVFTFYQDLTNVRISANGPIRVISREGTTTVYLNTSGGADFSKPDSFRSGIPIQTSIVRQQVVIDTTTQTFTAINEDTVASTSGFLFNGLPCEIGKPGDVLRTTRTGRLNSPGLSPIGWFGGDTVAAERAGKKD